eukprot:3940747-Rhodomonas_salina.1
MVLLLRARLNFFVPSARSFATFVKPSTDTVFRHLMINAEVRNSFLSSVCRDNVVASELISQSLNPIAHYNELAQFVNESQFKDFFKNMPDYDIEVRNRTTNRPLPAGKEILHKLGDLKEDLQTMLPTDERGSVMDIVCTSDLGIYNVEVQVVPQDCWDIRILHHVCGLFHKQFRVGMTWEGLAKDHAIGDKIKRVIGVSVFAKPPRYSGFLANHLPWYRHEPWRNDEVERRFSVQTDDGMQRGGIEFIDINLAGNPPDGIDPEFLDWFEFLRSAHHKTVDEAAQARTAGVRTAYEIVKTENLPIDVFVRYQDEMVRAESVVHFSEARFAEGKAEGKAEGNSEGKIKGKIATAKSLLRAGMPHAEVATHTGLTEQQLSKHLVEESEKEVK